MIRAAALGVTLLLFVWWYWWLFDRPLTFRVPQVGETWCMPSDGDPWRKDRPVQAYILELRAGWIRYEVGGKGGFPSTRELVSFRRSYRPCTP